MLTKISKIDKQGRIALPKRMRDVFGLAPETDVILSLTETGIVIKPKLLKTPITHRIAEMDLPVADWPSIEKQIEEEHLPS